MFGLKSIFIQSVLLSSLFLIGCTKKQDLTEKVIYNVSAANLLSLDPILCSNVYCSKEISRVYESLLEFHYLKRPYTLVPNLASEMPKVSEDGLTYTFKLRDDVFFHDNACFKDGKGRKMVAKDVVFSIKRLADAKNISNNWWLLDGKLVGLNEWRTKYSSKESNFEEVVEGLKAIDDSTVQFKLTKKFPQFLYSLAMTATNVVPREAVEKYGKEFTNHMVGTGPFITGEFKTKNKLVFTKNPNFRKKLYPSEGEPGDKEKGFLKHAGKQLPLVDKIITSIATEAQTRWLGFQKANYDFVEVPKDNFDQVVLPDLSLNSDYAKKGIDLMMEADLDTTYIAFNHDDPIFKDNPKLKQAMSMAYDHDEANKLFYNNTAQLAHGPIPPGIAGHDPSFKNPSKVFDIEGAKKKLAEAGYPEGKGLPVLTYEYKADTVGRQMADFFSKNMKKIGITVKTNGNTWPQLTTKIKKRQAQMWGIAWVGDYPDAENFLQLFYGPNSAPGANGSNFNDSLFNALFEKATVMQDSPERTKLYKELNGYIADKMPWLFGVHRQRIFLKHDWLDNFKFTVFPYGREAYLDVDLEKKAKLLKNF
ncbi:ABC transporter substrate-binding protein [Bacteriovoracaceae bacterium]|nr:ABC transporter substrate-binding protein [Bacteriovoracaceae bacterium]